ncbi:histone deacetylase 14, partial [Tanacetum coccineum]
MTLLNQDLFYLMHGNLGQKKYTLSLHKFPAVPFPNDVMEERTSRWKEQRENPERLYSDSKIVEIIRTLYELGHEQKFITDIKARRANGKLIQLQNQITNISTRMTLKITNILSRLCGNFSSSAYAKVAESAKITKNPPIGFALICPGHHAVLDGPLEFCSVGNVATAAGYAQHVHGLQRVFIIDFSAHPGKGTNDVFNDDPDVFFLSTHQ